MNEKITGYGLLTFGILIIAFSSFNVYQVFTKRSQPVQLFNFAPIKMDTSAFTPQIDTSNLPSEAKALLENQQNSKPTELIPAQVLNESSNIFAHLFLMGFIVSVGYKVSSLGVMLLRPVEVKVKTKEIPVDQQTQE